MGRGPTTRRNFFQMKANVRKQNVTLVISNLLQGCKCKAFYFQKDW
jgi:hypothetical protein